jgi:polyhydroxybutyrate depolymerase
MLRTASLAALGAALLCSGCLHYRFGGPSAAAETAPAGAAAMPSSGCRPGVERGHEGLRTITSDGRTRRFTLRFPRGAAPTTPAPLVLDFHGLLEPPPIEELLTDLTAEAGARGYVVVYPHGWGNSWNAGTCCGRARAEGVDDVRFVRDLVRQLERELCIDRRRIYATGMSNGGILSYRLACEASDLFAAIAPVAGVEAAQSCQPRRPVPVLAFNGTSDLLVRYGGGFPASLSDLPTVPETFSRWQQRNSCAVQSKRVVFNNGEVKCEAGDRCGAPTTLCTIESGGHTWPGGVWAPYLGHTTSDIDATRTMLDFFAGQALGN